MSAWVRVLLPGEEFAGYRIVRQLGAGGMGAVFLARHPQLSRPVALKVLTGDGDEEGRARFLREAELAARLQHPNVVGVLDRGVCDERLWIAMQFVPGGDAAAAARQGLSPERAVHIVTEAARGLDAAHAAGLLHRDVKPANILVSAQEDGPDRVLVTDFGIARAIEQHTALTAEGMVLATLAYAAPEQLEAGPIDHHADVYALGGTLYHLLTRSIPFPHDDPIAVLHAHLETPPPRPSTVNPEVPPAFDSVIARAMAKDPRDRYPSCGALAEAARAALRGEAEAVLPNTRRRRRNLLVGATVTLVAALAATLVLIRPWSSPASSTGATAPVAPPAIVTDGSGPWGYYGAIVAKFPNLLPSFPAALGYRGIYCRAVDSRDVMTNVALARTPDKLATVRCDGDGDPLEMVVITCTVDRSARPKPRFVFGTQRGEERWTKAGDTGTVAWGDGDTGQGYYYGLMVAFDSTDRNSCYLYSFGQHELTGQDLHDRWWADAPL
ncbi:serine/threonine protein kinase [Nocardia yamanashiensis]|uniref:serine/threonine-protein kinase n=1 Tax=Nocardia yamanashiensis TaxID=209247 RepID=UPI001E34DB9E|nr:serine/threonine-protein kinase [Nocardia yamanashiensis]UGT45128.1 serine/threonine protein kinase [Nocardia yamanashiensis]